MSRLFVSIMIIASALATAAPPAAASSPLVVCDTCLYTTIPAALAAATDGDTIVVRPGTYSGAIVVDKMVTLCSTDSATSSTCSPYPEGVTIDGAGGIYPVFITADFVTLHGFTIQNPTYASVDAGATKVDPSLVVVYGADDVQIFGNILQFPASPLAPTQSRWITDGVNVAADQSVTPHDKSDRVHIAGNIFRHFVEAVGPDGTCINAPCRMAAIDLWGAGAAPVIEQNNMLLPNGRLDSTTPQVVGIWGNAQNAVIRSNAIQSAAIGGLYAVKGAYSNTLFEFNNIYHSLHGIFISGSSNTLRGNNFTENNEGVRLTTSNTQVTGNVFHLNNVALRVAAPNGGPEASNLVFRENKFATNTRDFSVHAQVSNKHFDLRQNDWGAYDRQTIETFLQDEGTGNTLDISCFIDRDGVTRVCPQASFTKVVTGASWPRTVTLTDTSTFPGSSMASRTWTLPGGATSSAATVVLSLGPGAYSFGLTVQDGQGFTDSASDALFLTNAAPVFNIPDDHYASEGALFSLALGATDADGDALTYTLVSGPPGAAIQNGFLTWTPTHAQSGSHAVSISVTDGASTVSDSATVHVTNVPVAPVLANIPDMNVLETQTKSLTVSATSPSGSAIALAATGLPAGATFVDLGNGQGILNHTAAAGTAGTYPVTVSATSEGITVQKSFNIIVIGAVGLTYTKVTPTTVQTVPGATVTLTGTLKNTGTGSDAFVVTATSSASGWTVLTPASTTLAAGASAPVAVQVTLPANGHLSFITVKVCSSASPTTCATQQWRVEVPLLITLNMPTQFSVTDDIAGSVVVRYVDGSLASGVQVRVHEQSNQNLPFFESSASGVTNAAGEFAFVLDTVQAKHWGGHTVTVSAKRGDVQAVKMAQYTVGL